VELAIAITPTEQNPEAGDLAIDDAGSEVIHTQLTKEVAQRLTVRLNFFRGEWFVNLLEGTPYFQQILGKASDDAVRAALTAVILGTEGVASLISFTAIRDRSARTATVAFKARLEDGSTFSTADYPAFVVGL
jgi:hypothetical protein